MPADGLAPKGAGPSAGTVLTTNSCKMYFFCIHDLEYVSTDQMINVIQLADVSQMVEKILQNIVALPTPAYHKNILGITIDNSVFVEH